MQGAEMSSCECECKPQPEQDEEREERHVGVDDDFRGNEAHEAHGRAGDGAQHEIEDVLLAMFAGQQRNCTLSEKCQGGDLNQGEEDSDEQDFKMHGA